MTTYFSNIATVEVSPGPGSLMAPNISRGKVRVQAGSYEADGLADGDVINLFKLHLGDVVLLGGSWIGTEDTIDNSCVVSVGDDDDTDAADPDRYLEAASIAAAAVVQFNDDVACLAKVPYAIQKDCWCQALLGASGAITGDIRFEIFLATNN